MVCQQPQTELALEHLDEMEDPTIFLHRRWVLRNCGSGPAALRCYHHRCWASGAACLLDFRCNPVDSTQDLDRLWLELWLAPPYEPNFDDQIVDSHLAIL